MRRDSLPRHTNPGIAGRCRDRLRIACLVGFLWAGWVPDALAAKLDLARLGTLRQSGDLSSANAAAKAVDGQTATFSATAETTNAFWQCELGRTYALTRVELVTSADALQRNAANGLVLRVQDLRDQTVFQAAVTDPGPGATWSVDLPAGVGGRIIRLGLEDAQPNGAGRHQVVLAEIMVYGDPSVAFGTVNLAAIGKPSQTSDANVNSGASRAMDGDPATYSQTGDLADSYWIVELDRSRPIRRVEVVNRRDCCAARLAGLVLRVLNDDSNTVASATLANPGLGATWGFDVPPGTFGRYVRLGLEQGAANGAGDRIVTLAEVVVLTATNLARGRDSFMVRYLDSLPPASNANDGNYATEIKTTEASVDGYWEVDLGRPQALYAVRAVASHGFTARLSHATVRLFDDRHDSVFSQHLAGSNPTFEVDVGGPVTARYVRVGFENKERSHISGGIEWYLGLREVQVFGRPAEETGLLAFTASTRNLSRGSTATLSWRATEMHQLELYPGLASMGAHTRTDGTGELAVTPDRSVEYLLVGTNRNGPQLEAVTVLVDGEVLPVQITEVVADNRLSFEDGRREAPDWIELHNPNEEALDLAGYGLTDDPAAPRKWVFPAVSLPGHGYLVVFASGRNDPRDGAGFLHAYFQLDAQGESVVLTRPDGSVADAIVDYPPQREDLAYGRTLEGQLAFLEPTPGRPNLAPSYAGWLAPPAFSRSRGFITNAFTLEITHTNENAELSYSLDGREPATRYGGPLAIGSTLSVRANVQRPGFKSPRTVTHTYVLVDAVMAASYMNQGLVRNAKYTERIRRGLTDLPSVVVTVPKVPDDYIEREASVELFWPDGAAPVQVNCGFFRFGGAWTTFTKKNYRLRFRGEYGAPKLRAPLFRGFDRGFLARESFEEIDLVGGGHDMNERGFYMAGRFTEDTLLDMGSLNPHGRFVNVYINGRYWGQYHARERLTDEFLAGYLGGEREDYMNVRGNDNVGNDFIPGTPDPLNRATWETLRARRNSYVAVRPYLDVQHLTDFMLMWFYGNCETEYRAAGPIGPGSGFKFWIGDSDGYLRTSALTLDDTANPGPGGLFGALVAERHPDFMTLVADRIQRHFFRDGALTPARSLERLNARMLEVTNSLVAECARWGFRTPDNWESAAQAIRTGLFPNRTANLLGALRNRGLYPSVKAPDFNLPGGTVTNGFIVQLSGGSGTIYYTLDGTDPRLPGGGVAPGARIASGGGEETLIPAGSAWRYWDKGPPPSADWNLPDFDDRAWSTGNAELGYGDGGEATALGYGPDGNSKYPAYYFRRTFTVAKPTAVTELVIDLVRDDGAVVYLNGVELLRDNLPAGPVEYSTTASAAVGGTDESAFFNFVRPPTRLVAGANVLAVEVHQSGGGSTDVSFNLALGARSAATATGIVVEGATQVRARSRSGSTWSGLVEAEFTTAAVRPLAPGEVVISEVHYNPLDSDDYEFLELLNVSTNVVDLAGARLAGGVDFLFPAPQRLAPGAFALVVENAAAFAERYQSPDSPYYFAGLTVAGTWSGRLSDDGERVVLLTRELEEAGAVSYQPGGSWPQRANGNGSSLELRDPTRLPADLLLRSNYLAQPRHWRSSSLVHGSPGRLDNYARPVVLNESAASRDAAPGWIELHNPGNADVDLTGLFLSDEYDLPFRYAFAEETKVPAGGYLVLTDADAGFPLDPAGSDLVLLTATGTNVLRFIDTADFPEVDPAETSGRYLRSDGVTDYTELAAPTPANANSLPRVGPVVFSEIMYRPAAGHAEYVELVSLSTRPMDLYDPAHPTNTWSLAGAVTFAFPPGQQLPPCTPLVVCSTNPAAFRAQYGLGTDVLVFGPWTGALNNAGESLRLLRPGEPRQDGTVPRYRVDRVVYEPGEPWPAVPLGGEAGLERLTFEGYGNDPANWIASATPTPGRLQANRPPALGVNGPTIVAPGQTLRLTVEAADPDWPWQTVSVHAANLPPGARFDPAAGTFEWAVDPQRSPSAIDVQFVATDSAACPATTTVTQTITVSAGLLLRTAAEPGSAVPRFSFDANSASTYEVQYTESLAPLEWRLLERITDPPDGVVEFHDPEAPGATQRFYRVRLGE